MEASVLGIIITLTVYFLCLNTARHTLIVASDAHICIHIYRIFVFKNGICHLDLWGDRKTYFDKHKSSVLLQRDQCRGDRCQRSLRGVTEFMGTEIKLLPPLSYFCLFIYAYICKTKQPQAHYRVS